MNLLQVAKTDSVSFDQALMLNFDLITEKLYQWVNGGIQLLPNLIVAIVVFFAFYLAARIAKHIVVKRIISDEKANLRIIIGGLVKWAFVVAGLLFSATIMLPSFSAGNLISSLGIGSVAIGFAFKDILQNWLAGMLILLKQPFKVGDVIAVSSYEGVVEAIETRSTIIKKFNAERIVIPNSQIYTSAIEVKTAYPIRRFEYDVGIGYGDDINKATDIIQSVFSKTDGVSSDPAPDIATVDLAASWVTLRARWWVDTTQASPYTVKSAVINGIKEAFDENSIDMPFETQVNLFHNQTEETDGVRGEQREGWPK